MGLLLLILFAGYAIGTAAVLALLWRRVDQMQRELTQLRAPVRTVKRVRSGAFAPVVDIPAPQEVSEGPLERAARTWRLSTTPGDIEAGAGTASAVFTPATFRGLVLGLLATAPALGFFFRAESPFIVASGLAVGVAMMVVALRRAWTVAAWASVLTASAWATLGFALGAAHADPAGYATCVAAAGAAGLLYAHLRRATPGATMALAMSAAALALGSQTGMVGPAGAAFGVIVALAAIVGAMSLRLEAMHLAAFGAAVIGLFVLSGQASAAIWFTPVTSWAGALFLAIALVRVPHLGPRGVALAGTGAFGALGAILALNGARQGLADPFATAAALVILAGVLSGLIAAAALHRGRGLQGLRVSLWVLALAAFSAIAAAIVFALPAPFAASAFAVVCVTLMALNARIPDGDWRTFAGVAALMTLPFAAASAQMMLAEARGWPAWLLIFAGLAAPALVFAVSAFLASRGRLAALFELLTFGLAVSAASLLTRLVFSEGALLLQPVGFVETGVHAAVWLLAALIIGSRANLGAGPMRVAAINLLTVVALGVMAVASLLWTTDFWTTRAAAGPEALRRDTLGFLIPALALFGHWVFWRARADALQTRLVFGASMLLFAAFISVEALRAEQMPEWTRALSGAVSFAVALGLNFAPGIANAEAPPQRDRLKKHLHRNGRSEKAAKTRQRVG